MGAYLGRIAPSPRRAIFPEFPTLRRDLLLADGTRSRPVILVIDSLDFRNLRREALAIQGYEVVKAAAGQESVRLFGETRPYIVLLDMVTPGKDGIQAVQEILRREPEACVITISGRPAAPAYKNATVLLGAKYRPQCGM